MVELNYEIQPGYNTPAEVKTEMYFLYDKHNLYVAAVCYEPDMSSLRANIEERDECFSDDFVGLIIDTFNDHKKGYELFVNPYGIQGDGIMTPSGEDMSFDAIWLSDGKIYDDYWIVEIKIPFKSLTFPDREIQEWRLILIRTRPRSSRTQVSWIKIDRDNPSVLDQAGWLVGMKNIQGGKFLNIIPYAISSQQGYRENLDSEFVNEKIDGDAGINVKYGLTSNLNLDLTLNPDFSQVESDAVQIDVNTTQALYYDEKRPFFFEGSETFDSHLGTDIIYTRTINNPFLAAKLTGKVNNVKFGYISAYDENTIYIVPLEDYSKSIISNKKSFSNILRAKYDFEKGESYIGTIVTDRENGHGFNRTIGVDSRFHINKNYYWDAQIVGSMTKEPDDSSLYNYERTFSKENFTATFDGEEFSGIAFTTQFGRRAEHVSFFLDYTDFSPEFRAYNGFVDNNNFRRFELNFDFDFHPNGRIIEYYNLSPEISQEYNYNNYLKSNRYHLESYIQLKGQTGFYFGLESEDRRFQDKLYKDLYHAVFHLQSMFSKYFNANMDFVIGEDIYRTAENPRKADFQSFDFYLEVKPLSRFSISADYEKYVLNELNSTKNIFDVYTLRGYINYRFNKNLFFRFITQYNSNTEKYEFDPLLKFQLNPFTIFYIGSTHDYLGSNFEISDRQFFLKFQYLFQV